MHKRDLPILLPYQVCPGPWAKTILQMSLPLPKAGIIQNVFCSTFFMCATGTLFPSTVKILIGQGQPTWQIFQCWLTRWPLPMCVPMFEGPPARCSQCSLTVYWIIWFSQLVHDTIHPLNAAFFCPSICEYFPSISSLICSKAWYCSGPHVKSFFWVTW